MKRLSVSYEAQAAIEFEALAARGIRLASLESNLAIGRRSTDQPASQTPDADLSNHNSSDDGLAGEPDSSSVFRGSPSYRFSIDRGVTPWIVSPARVIKRAVSNLMAGMSAESISRRFHTGFAEAIVRTSMGLAEKYDLSTVALSGGVFQNRILLELVQDGLVREGLQPLMHRRIPSNDGGISLGQAVMAGYQHRVTESG
jgi:hydrogenase maturation factor HypF (carbamoyltransferase family)